jgi:hypothetical protein
MKEQEKVPKEQKGIAAP